MHVRLLHDRVEGGTGNIEVMGFSCCIRNAGGTVTVSGVTNRIVSPKQTVIVTGAGNIIINPQGLVEIYGCRNLVVQGQVPADVVNHGGDSNKVYLQHEAYSIGRFIPTPSTSVSRRDEIRLQLPREADYRLHRIAQANGALEQTLETLKDAQETLALAGVEWAALSFAKLVSQAEQLGESLRKHVEQPPAPWPPRQMSTGGGLYMTHGEARRSGLHCVTDYESDSELEEYVLKDADREEVYADFDPRCMDLDDDDDLSGRSDLSGGMDMSDVLLQQ